MLPSIRIPKSEFAARTQALLAHLKRRSLSGAVLFDATYILYYVDFAFIPTERPIALALNGRGESALLVPRLELEHAHRTPVDELIRHRRELENLQSFSYP